MLPSAAPAHYRDQQQTTKETVFAVRRRWALMTADFDMSWSLIGPQVVADIQVGKLTAARSSEPYVDAVLAQQGIDAPAEAAVSTRMVASMTEYGGDLQEVARGGVIKAKLAISQGLTVAQALSVGRDWLDRFSAREVTVAESAATAATIGLRQDVGWVRMLNPPSCRRCLVLAGKWFRWNEGFDRHPRCDCRHIPSTEDTGGDYTTDPYAYLSRMSRAEQDAFLGRSNARAYREGADVYRLINISERGLGSAKANRVYGTPHLQTVDDLLRQAGTRTRFRALLEEHGFITGAQVRGGNIFGRFHESYSQPISRPVVPGSKRDRVLTARATGVRDSLDRATMTAAERRLYDAAYRVEYARRTGYLPRSIGESSSDRWMPRQAATPEKLSELRASLARLMADAADKKSPQSLRSLAALLSSPAARTRPLPGLPVRTAAPAPLAGGAGGRGSGGMPPRYPFPDGEPFEPDEDAWQHILYGDDYGGGHLHTRGRLGKTWFPEEWTSETIAAAARAAQIAGTHEGGRGGADLYHVIFRDVLVRVVVNDGRIESAYPLRGEGVIKIEGTRVRRPKMRDTDRETYHVVYD